MIRRMTRSWANLPLRAKGLVVVAIPVVALLAVAVMSTLMLRRSQQAVDEVQRTLQVQTEILRVRGLLLQAEASQRGYILTQQDEFLEARKAASSSMLLALGQLRAAIKDPQQHMRMQRIERLVQVRLDLLETVLQDFMTLKRVPPGSLPPDPLRRSKQAMDNVLQALDDMLQAERQLVALAVARVNQIEKQTFAVNMVGLASGVLGGMLAVLLFTTGVVRRVECLEENALRLAQEKPLLPIVVDEDEIGRLESAMEATAFLLAERGRTLREAQSFLEGLIAATPGVLSRGDPLARTITYISPSVQRSYVTILASSAVRRNAMQR